MVNTPINTDRLRAAQRQCCQYCGGTGDVHSQTGDYLGKCNCIYGEARRLRADLSALKDPAVVLVSMLHGQIATPSPYALAGLFGENPTDLDSANLRIAELRQSLELARAQISELREQVAQLCGYDSAQEMDADR